MRLILARHGQSLANVDPMHADNDQAPLTEIGRQQADHLGRWLKENEPDIDHIMCSPFTRAHETANIANKYLNLPLEVNPDLGELNMEIIGTLPRREHPFQRDSVIHHEQYAAYYGAYEAKVQRALNMICVDINRPKPILIVSHGGTTSTLLRLILERPDIRFNLNNTSLTVVSWKRGHWYIETLNGIAHLPKELVT
jgi:broad specificity phosphatase PhoE